jgi:chromosomal replication initiator protein
MSDNGTDVTQKDPLIMKWPTTSTKNFDSLVDMVANYYDITVADLKWESRKSEIGKPRQLLMYIARIHFWWKFERIWEYFWKNYATVIHAVDVVEKSIKTDSQLMHDYRVFSDWVQQWI